MKHIALSLFILISSSAIAQNITIPDANFKAFLVSNYDTSGDGEISQAEAEVVTGRMVCSNLGIADLTGIQYFLNITELNCSSNQLTALPNISNLSHLQILNCSYNQLNQLPGISALTELTNLICHFNQLTQLPDLSGTRKLRLIVCENNQLTSLPSLIHQTELRGLYCSNNVLSELPDLSTVTKLEHLWCASNQLTSLPDLSALTQLERFQCYGNQLTELPDPSNLTALTFLGCDNNQLTALPDLTNLTMLEILSCRRNQLTTIPDLSALVNLRSLFCDQNQLTELPDLSNLISLEILSCSENQLTEVPDILGLPAIDQLICRANRFDLGDCPRIAEIELMQLSLFDYNPVDGNIILDCSCESPAITMNPTNENTCPGDPFVFQVEVTGTGPLSFQWQRDGLDITGATESTLEITVVSENDEGLYTCLITNACGSVTTDMAMLNVQDNLSVRIIAPPQGLQPVTLEALISCGTSPVSWEWKDESTEVVFGINENPVTLGALLPETTLFSVTVSEPGEMATAFATVLVANDPIFQDYNGDGCNTIQDLWLLAEDWGAEGSDANGDQIIDVRDLMFVDISGSLPCAP
ncbi:MAG: leucine-rich repeat domain-containing protein [Kangiellaceae bacterium]|jgi:Leucine-rich repeat (LRR) protein|nr:leucine-rich repeat domain-containing protein [Kangiellaceae bacterium]